MQVKWEEMFGEREEVESPAKRDGAEGAHEKEKEKRSEKKENEKLTVPQKQTAKKKTSGRITSGKAKVSIKKDVKETKKRAARRKATK